MAFTPQERHRLHTVDVILTLFGAVVAFSIMHGVVPTQIAAGIAVTLAAVGLIHYEAGWRLLMGFMIVAICIGLIRFGAKLEREHGACASQTITLPQWRELQ